MPLLQVLLSYLGIAIAVSIDGLAVGAVYSTKGLRIPPVSLAYISLATAALMASSMKMGDLLSIWVTARIARFCGGAIILALGIWQVWHSWVEEFGNKQTLTEQNLSLGEGQNRPKKIASLKLKSLGLIIEILRDPFAADWDSSGVIDPKESVMLGISLGLDAFAAGFGAGMSGFSWLVIPLVATFCPLLLLLGGFLGKIIYQNPSMKKWYVIPGSLLMLIGLLKMTGRL